MADSDTMVVVGNLRKSFDEVVAVADVSFTIESREIFGLLGPNGAGKTTTIRILSTVLPLDDGHVEIANYRIGEESDSIRKVIGVCPQELALYQELSAADNLVFFGRMAGLNGKSAREAARENLERVGLIDRAKDKVEHFSGGMKRRVNIAIALMSNPLLLFLDEPTVGIDPQSRNHIFETVEALRDQGMTILYTTHYMEEADRLCDRLGIIDHGRMIRIGTPTELKSEFGDPSKITLEQVFLELTGRNLRD